MKVSEFSIGRYYDYLDVLDQDGLDLVVKKAAFVLQKPYLEVQKMPLKESLKATFEFSTIEHDLKKEIPDRYVTVSGRRFKVVYEAENMESGQYIDFCEVRKAYGNNPLNFHALLAVMSIEVDKNGKGQYDGAKNSEKEKLFLEHAKMGDVYPYAFFLSARLKVLNETILPYFAEVQKKMMMAEARKKGLLKDGGGSSYLKGFAAYITRIWTRFSAFLSLSSLIGGLILKNLMTRIGVFSKK